MWQPQQWSRTYRSPMSADLHSPVDTYTRQAFTNTPARTAVQTLTATLNLSHPLDGWPDNLLRKLWQIVTPTKL